MSINRNTSIQLIEIEIEILEKIEIVIELEFISINSIVIEIEIESIIELTLQASGSQKAAKWQPCGSYVAAMC